MHVIRVQRAALPSSRACCLLVHTADVGLQLHCLPLNPCTYMPHKPLAASSRVPNMQPMPLRKTRGDMVRIMHHVDAAQGPTSTYSQPQCSCHTAQPHSGKDHAPVMQRQQANAVQHTATCNTKGCRGAFPWLIPCTLIACQLYVAANIHMFACSQGATELHGAASRDLAAWQVLRCSKHGHWRSMPKRAAEQEALCARCRVSRSRLLSDTTSDQPTDVPGVSVQGPFQGPRAGMK
jgi:hypothetical protein